MVEDDDVDADDAEVEKTWPITELIGSRNRQESEG
jgi:hypothetical protein